MSMPQSVPEVLRAYVTLKIEGMLAGGNRYRAKRDYVYISRAGESEKKNSAWARRLLSIPRDVIEVPERFI